VFRTTQDVLEIRRWAEMHGARPCRDLHTGRLRLVLPGQDPECEIGWDEFEPTFLHHHDVFVCDDAPGRPSCFVGATAEAQAFILGAAGHGCSAFA
jgi:hypothetical protein